MKNQKEEWKDIPNYEGFYQVSNLGNVKSLARKGCLIERLLKHKKDGGGYSQVTLSKKKQKSVHVHRLVAIAFLGHIPFGHKIEISHNNQIKTDNRVENLTLLTAREHRHKDSNGCTSKYIGVCWCKTQCKWRSAIQINRKKKYLGYYQNELEASNAYQKALEELL